MKYYRYIETKHIKDYKMIDYTKTIKDSEEIAATLSAMKDELLAEIKAGDMSLYPKYLSVCADYLKMKSLLA